MEDTLKRLSKKGRNWTELFEVGWRRQKLDGTVPTRIELRAVARLQNKTRQVSSAEGASLGGYGGMPYSLKSKILEIEA